MGGVRRRGGRAGRAGMPVRGTQPRSILPRPPRHPGQPDRAGTRADHVPARGDRRGGGPRLRQGRWAADGGGVARHRRAAPRVDGDLQRLGRSGTGLRAGRYRPARCVAPTTLDRLDPHGPRSDRGRPRLDGVDRPADQRGGVGRVDPLGLVGVSRLTRGPCRARPRRPAPGAGVRRARRVAGRHRGTAGRSSRPGPSIGGPGGCRADRCRAAGDRHRSASRRERHVPRRRARRTDWGRARGARRRHQLSGGPFPRLQRSWSRRLRPGRRHRLRRGP